MTHGPGAVRLALSDGLNAAGLSLGVALLAGSWLAAALAPGSGLPGSALSESALPGSPFALVLHASGAALGAGAGLLLSVGVPRWLRLPRVLIAVVLLLAGFAVVLAAVAPTAAPQTTAAFPASAAKVAVLAFAANAGRRYAPLTVCVVLVAAMEAICAVLGPRLGLAWSVDVPVLATLVLMAVVTLGFGAAALRLADPRRAAATAAEQEALTRTRGIARSRAAAVVHDTVLGDLAALSILPPGPLPPASAAALRRTLTLLASPDWAAGAPTGPVPLPGGAVRAAIRRMERAGLAVRVDGDLVELVRLDPDADHALAQAVEQCLDNVRRHAGTTDAEISVLGDDDRVTVMVADAGRGFDPATIGPDRMGLATAVLGRMRAAGGSARVFASPGEGTTVVLSVPAGRRA